MFRDLDRKLGVKSQTRSSSVDMTGHDLHIVTNILMKY